MIIQQVVENIHDDMIALRRHIHENPELSMKEVKTTSLIRKTLEKTAIEWLDIDSDTGLIGLLHGEAGEGPVLLLRADIDALPIHEKTGLPFSSKNDGVMHACGHDLHTTVLTGAAIVLDRLRDQWKGTIKFVFQPAEEIMGGAQKMIKWGVLNAPKPDHVVCLHTWPSTDAGKIGIKEGPMMAASDMFEVTVKGVGGHAAHPHKSIDPVPVAVDIISGFQKIISRNISPLDPAVLTIGQIHGGTASNIIANDLTFSGTIRTLLPTTRDYIKKRMEEIARHTAEASGAEAELLFEEGCPPVINDGELVGIMDSSLRKYMGKEAIDYLKEPSMGGEDFAFYLEHVPGMLFRLGTGAEHEKTRRALHNPGIVFDEKAIPAGITAMSGFAIEYLSGRIE